MDLLDRNGVSDQEFKGIIKGMSDPVGMFGRVTGIQHFKPHRKGLFVFNGERFELYDEKTVKNTLCNLGNALAAKLFADNTGTRPSHMAVGTTSGGKTSASTTLEAEAGRVALDSTTCPASGAANDNVVTYVATFPAGTGTGALVEAAILNAASNGTMICYAEYGVVTKAAADIVIFTWTLTFGTS